MKYPQRERFRYEAVRVDGMRECLVHTAAPFENHSAVRMFELHQNAAGREQMDSVHDRILQQLLACLASEEEACAILMLLLWRKLLEKERPLHILWAGGRVHAWEQQLMDVLHMFHKETRVWQLNGETSDVTGREKAGFSQIAMDWEALLIPCQEFDVIIVEDDGTGVPLSVAEVLFEAVKPWGQIFVSSTNPAWRETLRGFRRKVPYRAQGHRIVTCCTLLPEEAAKFSSARMAMDDIRSAIVERIRLIAPLLDEPLSVTDAEVVLETAFQMEQGICQIFPALHSMQMKYEASEWKRALLAYVLDQGDWDEVSSAFRIFCDDVMAEGWEVEKHGATSAVDLSHHSAL